MKKIKENIVFDKNLVNRVLMIFSIFLIIGIIIVGSIRLLQKNSKNDIQKAKVTLIPQTVNKILNSPDITIKSIENVNKVGSLYQFILILETKGKSSHYVSYITTDGKFFFPEGIDVDKIAKMTIATPSATQK